MVRGSHKETELGIVDGDYKKPSWSYYQKKKKKGKPTIRI